MKVPLFFAVALVAATGCSTKYGLGNGQPTNTNGAAPTGAGAGKPEPAAPAPVSLQQGRIASVRGELKFVVVDFAPGTLPQIGQRMDVYRGTQKVAELLISGPAEGLNIAADVLNGMPSVGDSVR